MEIEAFIEIRQQIRGQFLSSISDYSEEAWCAGWMHGVEEEIRKLGGVWVFMAYGAGGWPKGYMAENGWDPLTKAELELVRSMETHQKENIQ